MYVHHYLKKCLGMSRLFTRYHCHLFQETVRKQQVASLYFRYPQGQPFHSACAYSEVEWKAVL